MAEKKTHEDFLKGAIKTHGDKYEYPEEYVNADTKIAIKCKKHGIFFQLPREHVKGKGCRKCSGNMKKTHEEYVRDARKVQGNKYEYPGKYVNAKTKIDILCKEHGIFKQSPDNHINKGKGCPVCGNIDRGKSNSKYKDVSDEEMLIKLNEIHKNKYKYPNFNFRRVNDIINIECLKHGIFEKTLHLHLNGQECPKCSNRVRKTKEEYVKEANIVHSNYYSYDKFIYVNNRTNGIITCPKHGDFPQTPKTHLRGSGCPKCSHSHGEKTIAEIFEQNKINYVTQYKIKGYKYKYDFYLSEKKLLIEYHGEQHYKKMRYRNADKKFEQIKINDKKKIEIAKAKNINLLIIPYTDFDKIEIILKKNKII